MTYCPNPNCNVHPIFLKHRSIPYHTRFWLNVRVRTCILYGVRVFGVSTGSPENPREVVVRRAEVLQHPPMAGGAAHNIQVYTQILAKPKQQGKGTVLTDSTLQKFLFHNECERYRERECERYRERSLPSEIWEIRSQGDIRVAGWTKCSAAFFEAFRPPTPSRNFVSDHLKSILYI